MNGIDDSSGGQGFGLAWRTERPALPCVATGWGLSKQLLSVQINHWEFFLRLCDRESL